ncbi:hypothetical protein Ddc_00793 [Ditylenchus destructor]|nr:hypothetical protein Ddc_00793 [Ditylenchus destructor]
MTTISVDACCVRLSAPDLPKIPLFPSSDYLRWLRWEHSSSSSSTFPLLCNSERCFDICLVFFLPSPTSMELVWCLCFFTCLLLHPNWVILLSFLGSSGDHSNLVWAML